jgi:hypothetical protein
MHRPILLALLMSAAFAQSPPADVDKALRDRIDEFYKYHVNEEYRKAEKLVAEDSQDLFYIHNKPHYLSFEIKSIKYSDDFTKAKVTVQVQQYVMSPGFQGKPLTMPSTSSWKVIDGKWFWFVDPEELASGPFGHSANAGTKPGAAPKLDEKLLTTLDVAVGKVKADKQSVIVSPGGSAEVIISNQSPGTVSLSIFQTLPEIEVKLSKDTLNRGETAVVTLKGGENPHTGMIGFRVSPTNEVVSFEVKRH